MKRFLKVSLASLIAAVTLTSCNCFKKISQNIDEIGIVSTPAVLTLKGTSVDAVCSLEVPAKTFTKTATLKVTPVLVYEGGEIVGTPKYFQGESVKDNYTVVSYSDASTISLNASFEYKPEAKRSQLVLRVEVSCKSSEEYTALPEDIFVAEGVSTVQLLADEFAKLSLAKDNFKRITTVSESANIMYAINSSVVRSQELTTEELETLQNFIKDNEGAYRRTVSDVYAKAYASPDGPLKLNDKLSTDRGTTTEKAITKKFSKDETPYKALQVDALGEDWAGFKELVQASDIAQKDLILQILQMTQDPQKRDEEIKNLSAVFTVLAEKILPELRRSKLQVDVDIEGLSDEEIKDKINNDANSLSLEELLYGATLFAESDLAPRTKAYEAATKNFPSCYRAWNNYGVVLAKAGKVNEAKGAFTKAANLNSSSNEVINNLGAIALFEGNTEEAKKYFATINTPDAKYNLGLVCLAEGDYATAVKTLSGYNLAVAEVCNGNISGAKAILASEDSAAADYLKAIIAAKEGDGDAVNSNLAAAIAKDSSYEAMAANEVEFIKFVE